jgi:hypothetical protein
MFSLSEQFIMQVCVFPKAKTDKYREKSKPKQQKKRKEKKNIYTVYTGLSSIEIPF